MDVLVISSTIFPSARKCRGILNIKWCRGRDSLATRIRSAERIRSDHRLASASADADRAPAFESSTHSAPHCAPLHAVHFVYSVPREGLEPSRLATNDFESFASTIPPPRLREHCLPGANTHGPGLLCRRQCKDGPKESVYHANTYRLAKIATAIFGQTKGNISYANT